MKGPVLHIIVLAFALCCFASCNNKDGEIIPRATLSKIYADMFVADSWLSMAPPEDKHMADTTAFYEPVFEKYGYTTADYLRSVEHYLNDPERFSRMLKKTGIMLKADIEKFKEAHAEEIAKDMAARDRGRNKTGGVLDYADFIRSSFFTDVIELKLDGNGVYVPSMMQEDISYRGPSIIVREEDPVKMEMIPVPVHIVELPVEIRR